MGLLDDLLGQSPAIAAIRDRLGTLLARHAAGRPLPPVLIQGETGTGKGLLARAIHRASPRSAAPFVDVNCAAIPETLLEAEMFGFERGAFTDARQAKAGLFQTAHRGTLFLDEVGLLPEGLQAKLLKVIEERAVRRLGSTRAEPMDVWILTATNEDLAAAIRERRFREDLYHRLAVLTVSLPPLRERGNDILRLAEHFLARACIDYHLPPKTLGADARSALLGHPWPGNVRELGNVVERVALLTESPVVTAEMLALPAFPAPAPPAAAGSPGAGDDRGGDPERLLLQQTLTRAGWNISRAAAALGITRNTLRYRIEKHGLGPEAAGAAPRATRRSDRPGPSRPSAMPAPAAPPTPKLRWERRRITFLRAALYSPVAVEQPYATHGPEVLVDKIESFGGRVEELSPTGIVAAFGLSPVEDAPRHAAHAAMAIQKAAERARRGDGVPLHVRMAIHVGQFLVGEAGGAAQIELDAKREAWTVLERLLTTTEPDATRVSAAVAPFLERHFGLAPAEMLEGVSGLTYRLEGRERRGLAVGPAMARFVGRRHEMDFLEARLAQAMDGHGQLVGIVGDAGIGKSRLLFEFRQAIRHKPLTYLEGRCLSYGSTVPYLPLLEILRQNFGITAVHGPAAIADKIRTGLRVDVAYREEALPYLLQLFGVTEGAEALSTLSPEAIKARTLEVFRQLCLRASRRQPIVFVLEDLHWIDRTSEDSVASLVESLAGSRILLLATYRPGYRPTWMDKSYATQIALSPLSREEGLSVVRSALQTEQLPDPLARTILDKAEGNPFFLEELARVVRDQGESRPDLAVPDTIQEVLLARIHRLPDGPRQALQAAALLGREAPLPLLSAIWDGPTDVETHLRELLRLEFLYEHADETGRLYAFKHALTQEVAYASLSAARRQALHGAAGRALETLHAGRLADAYEPLAHHYARSQDAGRAVEYLMLFAKKAATLDAHEEAVRALEEADRHAQALPAGEREGHRLDLALRQASSLIPLGRLREVLELLLPYREPLERQGDAALSGRYHFLLGRTYSFLADHERSAWSAERAIAEAERAGDRATKGKAYCLLAQDAPLAGRALEGIAQGEQAVALLQGAAERWWLGHAYWVLALNHGQIGSFGPGLEAAAQAQAIAEATGDTRLEAVAAWAEGILRAAMGEWQAGIDACRRALGRAPDPLNRAVAAGWLGFACMEAGATDEAVRLLEGAARQFGQFGYRPLQGWFTAFLAEAHRAAGQLETAREVATRALGISRDAGVRVGMGWARHALGRIAHAGSALQEAESELQEALRLFESIQSSYEMGRTRLDLGLVAHSRGDVGAAADHLRRARHLFASLGVPHYVQRVDAAARDIGLTLDGLVGPG